MTALTLTRREFTDEGTFGMLALPDGPLNTIELPWRDNKRDYSCIPPGEYACVWMRSQRLDTFCYHVQDVAGRGEILIHAANLAGDVTKGWRSDVEGCIGLGMRQGVMTVGNKQQRAVLNSRVALSLFEKQMGYHSFILHIENQGAKNA